MQIKKGTFARFNLVNGQGLIGSSNNEGVVPNSDAAFTGKTGQDVTRTVEIYGLGAGTAMVGFSAGAGVAATLSMQVEVVPIPGKRPSLVSFSAKTAALNGPGLSTSYQLDFTKSATSGPPENLFDGVPSGTKHIAINCHGQMTAANGITLFIAGNITRDNCSQVFAKLKATSANGVVWIGGCEVGADNEFCKSAALASGCFVVAPAITLPVIHVPVGKIDYFGESMVKVFSKDSGAPASMPNFLMQQRDLQFRIIPA